MKKNIRISIMAFVIIICHILTVKASSPEVISVLVGQKVTIKFEKRFLETSWTAPVLIIEYGGKVIHVTRPDQAFPVEFVIEQVKHSDAGVYRFTKSDNYKSVSFSIELRVFDFVMISPINREVPPIALPSCLLKASLGKIADKQVALKPEDDFLE